MFKFFRKTRKAEAVKNSDYLDFNETGYVCNSCGQFNPMRFKFCPNCGTERFKQEKPGNASVIGRKIELPRPISAEPKDEILSYLEKIGLLQCAEQQYCIRVQLENGSVVSIPVIGRMNSNDALRYLRNNAYIQANVEYRFSDWPKADPCIGPWYHHVSACVCELDEDRIYHVESFLEDDIITLYGCPNPKSIGFGKLSDYVEMVVVDYEK